MTRSEKMCIITLFVNDLPEDLGTRVREQANLGWPICQMWVGSLIEANGITQDGWAFVEMLFDWCLELGMEA